MNHSQIIEAKNLNKTFGKTPGVSSLSFVIQKEEKIALIGPSGAGKSTLLNIIAKTIEKEAGDLIIANKKVEEYKSLRSYSQTVGMIRQDLDLVLQLPVVHNVLAGKMGEWSNLKSFLSLLYPKDNQLAFDALKKVGIEHKLYEMTENLSGGEKQRVAIARLLLQKPEILLADEPVSSLDPARADDIIGLLCNLTTLNKQTLIASLHSVELALKYFDRIIGLRNGEIVFNLPVKNIDNTMLNSLYDLEGV